MSLFGKLWRGSGHLFRGAVPNAGGAVAPPAYLPSLDFSDRRNSFLWLLGF